MNNLGKLIERKLKAEAARNMAREHEQKADEMRAKVAVLNAYLISPISEWDRKLAQEKRKRELVAGGDILWKPVDRTAAKVISKAPWWAFPIKMETVSFTAKPEKTKSRQAIEKEINKKAKTMSKGDISETASPIHVRNTEPIVGHELHVGIANGTIKHADKATTEAHELIDKAMDARAALEMIASTFQVNWKEFMDGADQRLRDYRIFRMAMDTETRQLMSAVREVRQFFLDPTYETERARLKEFVEICERLKALKDSGFLDNVADTMLKLSVKP